MSDRVQRHLIALPGAVEREDGEAPGPDLALRRLLASHPYAPGLLAEARHWWVVARSSARQAVAACRRAREEELGYELARRKADPRGVRRFRFMPAAACLAVLLAVCGMAGGLVAWSLPWVERIVFGAVAAILAGVVAWQVSMGHRRAGLVGGFILAGLVGCAVVTWPGPLLLRAGGAVTLVLAVAAAVVAGVCLLKHAESWHCWRLRRASAHAARYRQAMLEQVASDEAAARAAMNAWESLVVEECQLAHPGAAVSEDWLARCVDAARRVATPTG